jgi:hypothetical protein
LQSDQTTAKKRRVAIWPIIVTVWWIFWGIVAPTAALVTEKITELCARTFFDPTPTDWHFLLIGLVPATNLVGELLRIRFFAKRFSWINSPAWRWINGMAIGISGFYAVWFLPLSLICAFLFVAGGIWLIAGSTFWLLIEMATRPATFWESLHALLFQGIPAVLPFAGVFLLPLAPLMSCLSCVRMRWKMSSAFTGGNLSKAQDTYPDRDEHLKGSATKFEIAVYILLLIPVYLFIFGQMLHWDWALNQLLSFLPNSFSWDTCWTWGGRFGMIFVIAIFLYVFWLLGTGPAGGSGKPFNRIFLPVVCGLLMLVLIEVPSTATRVAMSMAQDPKTASQGLLILRAFGDDDALLRMCYERSHATDLIGTILTWGKPIASEKAREMYYRVTGRPFNSRGIPASFRGKTGYFYDWNTGADDVFDADAQLAGETVGGVGRGVALDRSDIKAEVDQCGTAALVTWDMEFKNTSQFQREARAQVLLPPKAVVSSAYLWINGTPHRGTVGSRRSTRAAYVAVVTKRRDPLLVTTYGPDRILVQCFPVPPNGTMHIQLGITTPLLVDSSPASYLPLPLFLERNFQATNHSVSVTGGEKISNPSGLLKEQQQMLGGNISNQDLSQGKATILVQRDNSCHHVWCNDTATGEACISLVVTPEHSNKPKNLVVVIDGSSAMADDRERIAKILTKIPDGINLSLLRAGDSVETLVKNIPNSSEDAWKKALITLQLQTFVGGQDDSTALLNALDMLNNESDGAILWLHGPQPVEIDSPHAFAQRLASQSQNVTLYELQLENGPNRTAEALDDMANVKRLPIAISPEYTLEHLFAIWSGKAEDFQPVFSRQDTLGMPLSSAVMEQQVDLSPLWANQAIMARRKSGDRSESTETVGLAMAYGIVTPISGAVVLESDRDYRRFGLRPPPKNSPQSLNEAKQKTSGAAYGSDSRQLEAPPPQSAPTPTPAPALSSGLGVAALGPVFSTAPEPEDWIMFFCVAIFGLFALKNRLFLRKRHES